MRITRAICLALLCGGCLSAGTARADEILTYKAQIAGGDSTGVVMLNATTGYGIMQGNFAGDGTSFVTENLTFNFNPAQLNTAGAPFGAQANSLTGAGVLSLTNIAGTAQYNGVTYTPYIGAVGTPAPQLILNGGTSNSPYTTPTTTASWDLAGLTYQVASGKIAYLPGPMNNAVNFDEGTGTLAPAGGGGGGGSGGGGGTPVPEPAPMAIFALGLAAILYGRHRRMGRSAVA